MKENQTEKNIDNVMVSGMMYGLLGIRTVFIL